MKCVAVLALALGVATAFVSHSPLPTSTRRAGASLKMVAEEELGVTPPFGLLDPLGWMDTQPQNFERRRAVERKHGRIAMVAVVGMLVHNAGIEFPGYLSYPGSPLGTPEGIPFSSIPDGFAGLFSLPPFGLVQILLFCGIVETSVWPASEYSGNYGTGYPFGDLSDPEVRAFKLNLELNQGRAAMLGIFAANLQEGIQGQTLAEHIAAGGKILVPGLF